MKYVLQSHGSEGRVTKKKHQEHIQQVTNQNAMLVTMVQEHQKKIEKLMSTIKALLDKMTGA